MCIDGFLSLSSTEILHRSGILVLTMNSFVVKVCILAYPDIYILILLNNVISIWISALDRSNALTILLNYFSNACNSPLVTFDLDPV